MKNFLVVYDITDNKRRKKLSDLLEGYGFRVNLSVFELTIKETKLKKLISKIEKLVDKKYDSVRFYHICQNCKVKSFTLCKEKNIFEKLELFI